jgi:hypothetical protein
MKHRNSVLGFIATVGLTLRDGGAARAQENAISQDAQIYVGYPFGDRLQETSASGSTPRLATCSSIWTDATAISARSSPTSGKA